MQAHSPDPRIALDGLDGRLLVEPQWLPPCLSGATFGREAGYVSASPEGIRCKFTLAVVDAILTFHRDKRLSFHLDAPLSASVKSAAKVLGYQELLAQLQKPSPSRKRAATGTRSSMPDLNATLHQWRDDQRASLASATKKRKIDEGFAGTKELACAGSNDLLSLSDNHEQAPGCLPTQIEDVQCDLFADESQNAFAVALAHRDITSRAKTLEDLDRVIQADGKNAFALERRGKLHYMAGRPREALLDLNQAIAIEPSFAGALALRSVLHGLAGCHQQALDDINQAIAMQPQNAFALARRGALYALTGRVDEALTDFNAAISMAPQQAFALAQRGALHGQANRLEEAFKDFDQAIAIAPRMAFALARRGVLHSAAGRHLEALVDLNEALLCKPKDTFALAHRGRLQRDIGLLEEALRDLNLAIEMSPDFAFALACRGGLHLDAGRHTEALADFNATIALQPAYVFALACLNSLPPANQIIG